MNKSKFLKKSLAMLLALMLVLAMIPLSASAARQATIKDLYVNGKRAALDGNELSAICHDSTSHRCCHERGRPVREIGDQERSSCADEVTETRM